MCTRTVMRQLCSSPRGMHFSSAASQLHPDCGGSVLSPADSPALGCLIRSARFLLFLIRFMFQMLFYLSACTKKSMKHCPISSLEGSERFKTADIYEGWRFNDESSSTTEAKCVLHSSFGRDNTADAGRCAFHPEVGMHSRAHVLIAFIVPEQCSQCIATG